VARSVDDSQGHALCMWTAQMDPIWMENKSGQKQMDRQKIVLLRMSIPWVAESLAAYTGDVIVQV